MPSPVPIILHIKAVIKPCKSPSHQPMYEQKIVIRVKTIFLIYIKSVDKMTFFTGKNLFVITELLIL